MPYSETPIPLIYTIIPGLVVLIVGILMIISRIRFLRKARGVVGEVVSLEVRYPHGKFELRGTKTSALPSYLPQVRFTASNGREYTFIDNFASRLFSYQVGSYIPVVYDPNDPRRAFIKHMLTLWLRPVGISVFGVILLVFAVSIS
ncbi:MAG: DUF3592 domain-containing protein [Anaerolineales bacterium]